MPTKNGNVPLCLTRSPRCVGFQCQQKCVTFWGGSLRIYSEALFLCKSAIKPVRVQNCQFGNFLTALGKCHLLNRMIHAKLGCPAGRRLLEPSRRCIVFAGLASECFQTSNFVINCNKISFGAELSIWKLSDRSWEVLTIK